MKKNYDLIVIGAGPGGYVAAIRAAMYGMDVAVIEKNEVGGTCLNRGCIPTKSLLHTAELYHEIKCGESSGIYADQVYYQLDEIYERKNKVVKQLKSGVESLLLSHKIDLISGIGEILDQKTVRVKAEQSFHEISAKHILIATGSVPILPPIEGISLPGVVTSDALLDKMPETCKDLIIIGGGVIGVEFASIFNNLDLNITIIEAMDCLLPAMDSDISKNLRMILKKRGVNLCLSSKVEKILQKENGRMICYSKSKEKEQETEGDIILVAIGRRGNIEGLFGETCSPEMKQGTIVVDENFQTNLPGIYAIGDVIFGSIQLAHVASAQGIHAVTHMNNQKSEIDFHAIPSCIYTSPEIASVGLSEEQAKAKQIPIKIGKYLTTSNGKSLITMQERGFIKLIFDETSEILLGAQLMCARATDLISELTTAIGNRLTAKDLASIIRPHPTFSEGITEAVESLYGQSIHSAPRKK